jgi:ABC-type nitrate/sulfonate/bicarbonate transport system substrate-binding protein
MIAAFTAGNLDIATIGYWHAIRMLDQRAKIQAVAGICSGGSRVVVRKDVAVGKWQDLRGKACSVGRGSTQDLQFLLAMKNNGLAKNDIDYRDLGGNMAVHISALQQKQIEVASMWEPFASQVIEQGLAVELPALYENSFRANGLMVTMAETASKKRDEIQAVIAAHVKSTDDFNEKPDKYLQHAIKLSGFGREVMKMANENTTLEYALRKSDAQTIAGVASDFAYAKSNVAPKIDAAFDYSFLERATGKKAAELGA